MTRPLGTPPTPSARSSAKAPVEIEATLGSPSSPMRMIEPLPNWRSICDTAASIALFLSPATLRSVTRYAPSLSRVSCVLFAHLPRDYPAENSIYYGETLPSYGTDLLCVRIRASKRVAKATRSSAKTIIGGSGEPRRGSCGARGYKFGYLGAVARRFGRHLAGYAVGRVRNLGSVYAPTAVVAMIELAYSTCTMLRQAIRRCRRRVAYIHEWPRRRFLGN